MCPFCETAIDIARSYSQFRIAAAAVLASLLGAMTFRQDSAGAWVLGVVITFVLAWFVIGMLVGPWLQNGHRRYKPGPAVFIIAISLEMFLYGAAIGIGAKLLGTQRDVQEILEFFSVPLAWISPRFLITSQSGILDIVGTIVGNGFFFGPLLYICWAVVSGAFARSRPIKLSISRDGKTEDE